MLQYYPYIVVALSIILLANIHMLFSFKKYMEAISNVMQNRIDELEKENDDLINRVEKVYTVGSELELFSIITYAKNTQMENRNKYKNQFEEN